MLADVAGEPDARAVGGDIDLLGDVGAVEEHRVEAGLPFDGVAAVAGVPHEGVVAGAQEGHVGAGAAVHEVVPLAADEEIVPGPAIEGQSRSTFAGECDARVDGVVAREAVDRELSLAAFAPGDVAPWRPGPRP